jgi:hypothetical protein
MSGRNLGLAAWQRKFELKEQMRLFRTRIDWETFGGLPSLMKEHSIMLGMEII